jgi:NADH-quinone oxidoreductase subunit L
MVMGLGAGSLVAGQFHLLTHAFFKALLFLGSGCIIIGTHHEQDMRKMGGLKKYMPITFWCYLIGMLALSGVPPFAGFFSKDEILLSTFHRNKYAWGLATFAAFLTAFYMTRQMFMVFAGTWRGGRPEDYPHSKHAEAHGKATEAHEDHGGEPHEVPWNMWLPIAVLSLFAIGLGFFGHKYGEYIGVKAAGSEEGKAVVMGASLAVVALGLLLGWVIYGRKKIEKATDPDPLLTALGGLFVFLNHKWYIDELYDATIIRFTATCGVFFRLVDKLVIDGTLHAIAWTIWGISQVFRWIGDEFFINGGFDAGCESVQLGGEEFSKLENGRIQNYFRVLSLGAAILLLIYFFK